MARSDGSDEVFAKLRRDAAGCRKCRLWQGATQTVFGAAQLATETKLSPEELRKMVVTPGGTTAAGLAEMEKLRTSDGLIVAVQAAAKRGREMSEEFGQT